MDAKGTTRNGRTATKFIFPDEAGGGGGGGTYTFTFEHQKASAYDLEIPQSHTADQHTAP